MTFAKYHFLSLQILLLMFNYLIKAQEEFSSTVTETSATEFSTTITAAAAAENNNIYTTCDFDLENIENLIQYLPDICIEIYNNRDNDDLYNLYLEESQNFAKFYKKLNDYELREQPEGDKVELSEYPFETKLRNDIYSKVDWALCVTNANSSTTDYLNCLKVKRLEMADLIPSVTK